MDIILRTWTDRILALSSNGGLNTRRSRLSISAAVALVGLYFIYDRICKPPRKLRHLPRVGFLSYIGSIARGVPVEEIAKKVTLPVLTKAAGGLYMRFDQFGWTVHIARPEAAKRMLLKMDQFPKIDLVKEVGPTLFGRFAFGDNLVFLNGQHWKSQRKIASPAFNRSMPVNVFGQLGKKLFTVMDGTNGAVDFHDLTQRWTLDAIGLAGFDFDFDATGNPEAEWFKRYNVITKAMLDPLFMFFPKLDKEYVKYLPKRKAIHRELDLLLDQIDTIIETKRNKLKERSSTIPDHEKDILTLMIEAESAEDGRLSNEEMRSNICIFFFAGHDTTANALAYAAYHLATHPDIQQKAREEAIRVLGDEPIDVIPTLDQIRDIPYINMVIKETLRMNPPAQGIVPRYCEEDTEISGVFLPKGTEITVDIYELQNNPTVWDHPERFDPERFAKGGEAEHLAGVGLSWLPFSNGARQCIGMNFSLAEQRVLLPMLLRKYTWKLPENSIHKENVITQGVGLTKPKDLYIEFTRRY